MVDKGVVSNTMAYVRWTRSDVARVQGHYGLLAVGILRRSLRQHARAPHAYFAAPVRGRMAVYVVSTLRAFGGARQGPRIVGYVLQSAAPTGPSP
jgi:hypothetical protein